MTSYQELPNLNALVDNAADPDPGAGKDILVPGLIAFGANTTLVTVVGIKRTYDRNNRLQAAHEYEVQTAGNFTGLVNMESTSDKHAGVWGETAWTPRHEPIPSADLTTNKDASKQLDKVRDSEPIRHIIVEIQRGDGQLAVRTDLAEATGAMRQELLKADRTVNSINDEGNGELTSLVGTALAGILCVGAVCVGARKIRQRMRRNQAINRVIERNSGVFVEEMTEAARLDAERHTRNEEIERLNRLWEINGGEESC